jgi:hypothetical protein
MQCKDDYEWIPTFDENWGYCHFCHNDDFYAYDTCGSKNASGLNIEGHARGTKFGTGFDWFNDAVCECRGNELRIDGRCTTCGNNCADCSDGYCNVCEYGYWLDNTETVCINWCPSGTTYDDARESGKCVTDNSMATLIDLTFDCEDPTVYSPYIQRDFQVDLAGTLEYGNDYAETVYVYGGANQDAIQLDDPRPIMNRGYWFNGECQFLTIKGFKWALNFSVGGWAKWHNLYGSFISWSNMDAANPLEVPEFNDLYCPKSEDGKCRLENSNAHHRYTGTTSISLFVWKYFSHAINTYKGTSTVLEGHDGVVATLYTGPSYARIYENNETLVGAFTGENATYNYFWKGFLYSLRTGLSFDDATVSDVIHVTPASDFCTCEPDQCPKDVDTCLGVCAWNYWWNGIKCERCPYWCADGCQMNGLC